MTNEPHFPSFFFVIFMKIIFFMDKCTYIELFAGVGGLHIGLDRGGDGFFKCAMANQWEPSSKDQFAANIYKKRFPDDLLINDDICKISGKDIDCDMLTGGFCCQDYSIVCNKSKSMGIEGKKGVLWWEVIRLITEMNHKPKYLLLENVDRMLISPAKQRGRDFALILQSLINLGYNIEWRVINAADYGMPQKRKRVFMFGFLKGEFEVKNPTKWLYEDGILAKVFPVKKNDAGLWGLDGRVLDSNLVSLSNGFNKENIEEHPFENGGVVIDGKVYTNRLYPNYNGSFTVLGDILVKGDDRKLITPECYIKDEDVKKWEYVKGHKEFKRTNKDGYEYTYSEGAMAFPDYLDRPARTLITSEVSSNPNRFTHVIRDPENGRLRRLIPIELERIQMFPDNHTEGTTDKKWGFLMGNALVCGIVERIGRELKNRICR